MTERSSCLEHIVFVHSCIKSFVDQVKHLKEVKRGAGPGKVVEAGSARDVLSHPDHPYTRRLLRAARLDLVEPGTTIALED